VRNVQTYLDILEWMTGGPNAPATPPVSDDEAGAAISAK